MNENEKEGDFDPEVLKESLREFRESCDKLKGYFESHTNDIPTKTVRQINEQIDKLRNASSQLGAIEENNTKDYLQRKSSEAAFSADKRRFGSKRCPKVPSIGNLYVLIM